MPDNNNTNKNNEKEKFPFEFVATVVGVGAIWYCVYSILLLMKQQPIQQAEADVSNAQREMEEAEARLLHYQTHPELYTTTQSLQTLEFDPNTSHDYDPLDSPSNRPVGVDDDFYNSIPSTPPTKGLNPNRLSSNLSQPPSPKTTVMIEKIDSLDGLNLWKKLDPYKTGRVSKVRVLEVLSSIPELQTFVHSFSTPTLQKDTNGDDIGYENALLQRAVDKLAGANNEYVSYERWTRYLKGGTFDPAHIDEVD